MKKIKIFLGAYVNFPNAQNVNCDYIAKHLDKDKFEVHVMYSSKKPIDKSLYKKQGIHLHKLIHRRFLWFWSKLFVMMFGKYDVYYLPKCETVDRYFMKRNRGKSKVFIVSIEGVVGEQIPDNDEYVKEYYKMADACFSISKCVQESARKKWEMNTEVLYLGVDNKGQNDIKKQSIRNVVWIGSVIQRKRPEYLLDCAEKFPQLQFYMIGDGEQLDQIKTRILQRGITNIHCMGRISNSEVYENLKDMDLLLMTSDKEGLPKVIGEAMSMKIPTIYINEFYKVDYIDDGYNSCAVSGLEQMLVKVQYLLEHPMEYINMTEAAYATIQKYTWENLIKDYEDYFLSQYKKKQEN